MEWETVIGLEVHTQLATHSKIFSGSSVAYGAEPNTQASLVDLGMPGTLPVLNKQAVELAIRLGLAIGAKIAPRSVFARKNYFYPDLPKGYQISQYELPIVERGFLEVDLEDGRTKSIFIERAHLEEDAGKSLHEDFHGQTGIDLNRAGTPLLEIVTAPDMRSAKEAVAYLKALHALVRYLEISDGNMQEGSFRCDANVSVRPKGQLQYGTRAEIKNLNSFRFIEQAINFEVERQIEILESGGQIRQETRLYDPDRGETRSMRSKEDANDYRYFPDPDLLPVDISPAQIEQIRSELPELPRAKKQRFLRDYALNSSDIDTLLSSRALADYFEEVAQKTADTRLATSWVLVTINALLNKDSLDIRQAPVSAASLSEILLRIKDNTITTKAAKTLLDHLWLGHSGSVDELIVKLDLKQSNDDGAIAAIIDEIIANNPAQVAEYRSGKDKVFAFFVGQTMRAAKGKANPNTVNDLLKKKLEG